MPIVHWTSDRDALLSDLWRKGETAAACAAALNAHFGTTLSRNAVISRLNRKLGTDRTKRSAVKVENVLAKVAAPRSPKKPAQPWTPAPHPRGFSGIRCEKARPITTIGLKEHHCRWPIAGNSLAGTLQYCGDKAVLPPKLPYCAEHARIAYQPVRARAVVAPIRRAR